ncbi:MAG TPA: 4'-phosphopantetheinyl transferase superfamily protein [Planctomycetota bacterium]
MNGDPFARALGLPMRLAAAAEVAVDLAPGERTALDRLKAERRRDSWLRGRAALKALLGGIDTSALRFPNAELSLTHTEDVAVAVACEGAGGVGIDLEVRPPSERAARRFLSAAEFEAAGGPDGWLRLWTVKEARFKADLRNQGRTILEYAAEDPRFRHASVRVFGGWLTVALAVAPPRRPR